MISGMRGMTSCGMSMMGRFFVLTTLVILRCFVMVTSRTRMMLRRLPVVLRSFFGHVYSFQFVVSQALASKTWCIPWFTKRRAPVCAVIVWAINPAALIAFPEIQRNCKYLRQNLSVPQALVPDSVRKKANNPQQSWGFEGEPPKAVMKDSGTRDGLYEDASFSCNWSNCLSAISW
jgi:hypothetical protein